MSWRGHHLFILIMSIICILNSNSETSCEEIAHLWALLASADHLTHHRNILPEHLHRLRTFQTIRALTNRPTLMRTVHRTLHAQIWAITCGALLAPTSQAGYHHLMGDWITITLTLSLSTHPHSLTLSLSLVHLSTLSHTKSKKRGSKGRGRDCNIPHQQ
jgi:hypothetical protein